MQEDRFEIDVASREAFSIVGISIHTNMNEAFHDCPRLWSEVFGPRMEELPTFAGPSFGVSVIGRGEGFDYWAGVIHLAGQLVPEGMATLDLAGGLYACCNINGLPGLAAAYQYIYHVWGPGSNYEFNLEAPCYELYPANHMQTGNLSLYMPVRPKK